MQSYQIVVKQVSLLLVRKQVTASSDTKAAKNILKIPKLQINLLQIRCKTYGLKQYSEKTIIYYILED